MVQEFDEVGICRDRWGQKVGAIMTSQYEYANLQYVWFRSPMRQFIVFPDGQHYRATFQDSPTNLLSSLGGNQ